MPIATDNTLSNLLDLYTKARGTSETSTTGSNISKEGVDGMLQQILSSSQGLAAVSSGQKAAGLYNSSANSMLTNDLLTSAAGKVAALQAGTTTTTKKGGIASGDLGKGLLLAGAKSILGPSVSGLGKKFGIGGGNKSIGDQVADMLGLGADQGTTSIGGGAGTDVSDFSVLDFAGGGGSDSTADLAGSAFDAVNGMDLASDQASSAASDVVGDLASDSSDDIIGSLFG